VFYLGFDYKFSDFIVLLTCKMHCEKMLMLDFSYTTVQRFGVT